MALHQELAAHGVGGEGVEAPGRAELPFCYSAPAPAHIPLPPFGVFGLDPALTIPLQPIYLPPPGVAVAATANLPADSALEGLTIHAQAMIVDPLVPAHFTNVVRDRIVR